MFLLDLVEAAMAAGTRRQRLGPEHRGRQVLGPDRVLAAEHRGALDGVLQLADVPRPGVPLQEVVADCERRLIRWALAIASGNQVRAAELLRLSRTTMRNKMSVLGLTANRSEDTGEE